MQVQPLGREDSLEKEMATHSSILAWEIPWTAAMELKSWIRLSTEHTDVVSLALGTSKFGPHLGLPYEPGMRLSESLDSQAV